MRKARVLDVTVVLLDAGYASTAIGPVEVFHSAGSVWNWLRGEPEQPRFRVRTASLDGRAVRGLCGLSLKPELALDEVKRTDLIIVSASGWDVLPGIARKRALLRWLRKWHARGAYVAGVCTAVAFLAEAGLLDGKEATTHWGVAELYRERYPRVKWQTERFLTEDGGIFCSGGVYAALDLSLHLVEKFCGREVALQCAKALLLGMPRSSQSGYSTLSLSHPHADEPIRRVEQYMQQHFAAGPSVEALAARARMSPRNFMRRFKAATGRLPGAYLQVLRMAAAKEVLEQGRAPIERVSERVGYRDAAFFRAVFKRHAGMTPAEYRARFARMAFGRELEAGRR